MVIPCFKNWLLRGSFKMVVISVDCVLSQNTTFLLFTNFACILVPNLGYIRVGKRVKLVRSRCISFETEEEV